MGFKEIIEKLKGMREEREELPDDVTRDKHLRSLRRERRTQMEEVEKEQLIKDIAEFKKERMRKHLFGIKDNIKQKKLETLKKKKQASLLSEDFKILGENKKKAGKTGFLDKYNL